VEKPKGFEDWPREVQEEFERRLAAIKARETPLLWEQVELGIAGVKGVARPKQLPPDHPKHHLTDAQGYRCESPHGPDGTCPDWEIWLFLAGRGTGKTKAGAQWCLAMARSEADIWVGVCAPTFADVKNVCFEGQSGIINEARPGEIADYNKNGLKITLNNGSVIQGYSAEKPDSVRGANLSYAWFDELAMIRYFKFYDYGLMPALRIGDCPRLMITTTPKRMKLIRKLMGDAKIKPEVVHLTHATSDENPYIAKMTKRLRGEYAGTYLERQELGGEFLDEVDGALFTVDMFSEHRVDDKEVPSLKRVIVSIDPATTSSDSSDETGIVVAGLGEDNHVYILDDCSLKGSPTRCMEAAVAALEEFSGDYIVGETNGVGDYMLNALRVVNPHVAFKPVRGMKGKFIRAVPASLYAAQGKVHMVGTDVAGVRRFEKLEAQLCAMTEDDDRSSMHDDRADAFVWTILEFRDAWQGSMKEAYGFTTCTSCGADVHEKKDKRCKSCGHEVQKPEELKSDRPRGSKWSDAYMSTCGKCGQMYSVREKQCPACFMNPGAYMRAVAKLSGSNNLASVHYSGRDWLKGRKV
jgi:phage terminase large subunit-like protein